MAMYRVCTKETSRSRQLAPSLVLQKDDVIRFGAGDLLYDMRPAELQAFAASFMLVHDEGLLAPRSQLSGPPGPRPMLNPELYEILQRCCAQTGTADEQAISEALLRFLFYYSNATPDDICSMAARLATLGLPLFAPVER